MSPGENVQYFFLIVFRNVLNMEKNHYNFLICRDFDNYKSSLIMFVMPKCLEMFVFIN